jgi:hypothetical protein
MTTSNNLEKLVSVALDAAPFVQPPPPPPPPPPVPPLPPAQQTRYSVDLVAFACSKRPGLEARLRQLQGNGTLQPNERIYLQRMHIAATLNNLSLVASDPQKAPLQRPPLDPYGNIRKSAECSLKECRCVGRYVVMSNGNFHGSHKNTGCNGVPVTRGKRKRVPAS